MSSGSTGLAGRYAGALYALPIDSDKVDSIHHELGRLSDLIDESDIEIEDEVTEIRTAGSGVDK